VTQLEEDLKARIAKVFREQWETTDAQKVPDTEDIALGNKAKKLEAVILYADMRESTQMVRRYKKHFAAEIYKTFLYAACRIIRDQDGSVSAFDGDRVMGVFVGSAMNTNAGNCGLKINYAVTKIVQPALEKQYPTTNHVVKHTVGIDRSEFWVARTGIRGSNDLVWVGNAANQAANLSAEDGPATWVTADVYDRLNETVKYGGDPKTNMWKSRSWEGKTIYTSTWWRSV
jgi:class 3 adenylate cyclase